MTSEMPSKELKSPAESVQEMGDEVSKEAIRKSVWNYLEDNNLAQFPRPVHYRIPNFVGAASAAEKMTTLDEFKSAQTVKINPDKPQENGRFLSMEAQKNLLVPTPRLKHGLFNKLLPPPGCGKDILHYCSTSQGLKEYSVPIGLEAKVKVDLIVLGSVAVSNKGDRIGKGEGYADLEYAMMCAMGAISKDTCVVTTVHDSQVIDFPESVMENHDIVVDYIVTDTQIIKCKPTRPKPTGIIWSKLTPGKLKQIPILEKLKEQEEEAGKDVTLKEVSEEDERADRKRPNYRFRYRRNFGRPRRNYGGRYPAYRRRRTDDNDGEPQENGDVNDGDDKRRQNNRGKFRYRRRGPFQRRTPRNQEDSDNAGDSSDRPPRQNRKPIPTVFIGSIQRSVTVSALKAEIRGKDVKPIRVIWNGAKGYTLLQFKDMEEMEAALSALKDLEMYGKKLRVEMSNRLKPGEEDQETGADGDKVNEVNGEEEKA